MQLTITVFAATDARNVTVTSPFAAMAMSGTSKAPEVLSLAWTWIARPPFSPCVDWGMVMMVPAACVALFE
jgi:hypothetical protein